MLRGSKFEDNAPYPKMLHWPLYNAPFQFHIGALSALCRLYTGPIPALYRLYIGTADGNVYCTGMDVPVPKGTASGAGLRTVPWPRPPFACLGAVPWRMPHSNGALAQPPNSHALERCLGACPIETLPWPTPPFAWLRARLHPRVA